VYGLVVIAQVVVVIRGPPEHENSSGQLEHSKWKEKREKKWVFSTEKKNEQGVSQ
jgi:hypothetical protein